MNILFTICARAGSKGLKNKNLKEMNGVPLLYYTLSAIRLYGDSHPENCFTVALNTDSKELVRNASEQHIVNDIVFVDRDPVHADDKSAKVEVIRDTLNHFDNNDSFDMVIDLDLTSPLRTKYDIENAIRTYCSDSSYDLVVSVVESRRSPYFNMVEKKDGYYRKICDSDYTTRQETPNTYELNASIYVYATAFLMNEHTNTILDNKCGVSIMRDYLVLDIDSEEDYQIMEMLHRYYCKEDIGINEVYALARRAVG